ncbi:FecCD family ABC transporter permease [Salipiger mangrovisoli]|uniref:Iron ABC transporter permease n=1 Tax=Salipiger mangrovisoli TaxID=2865933 RepID=A0ABR9WY50_9RHOB|nr:iron ABC transporter permease [Salipiger mangrovisoli]MBE9636222.1 iron ABC transporter permease [Salipiger mangrovisoli]
MADASTLQSGPGRRLRTPAVLVALTCCLLVVLALGLGLGAVRVPAATLLNTLLGLDGPRQDFIVLGSRLPRTLLGALTGAALGLSGAIIQSLLRNPLASPKIVGINSGAAFAVLLCAFLLPDAAARLTPFAAAVGGVVAGSVVWLMAGRLALDAARLTLVGIAVGFVMEAGVEFLLVTQTGPEFSAPLVWLTGSLWGRGWTHLWSVAPALGGLMALALLMSFRLDLQYLGPQRAAALGVRLGLERGMLLVIGVLLAALSVGVVGVVGFIGLMAPHIAARLVGGRHRALLPTAALVGAILCAGADVAGRALMPPIEISAGILTALLGAPFFIWLLLTEGRRPGAPR